MKPKILLLGKNGQLGWELAQLLPQLGDVIALGQMDLNLLDLRNTRASVRALCPGLIVNAAAFNDVDLAEQESELAMAINSTVPGVLAEEASRCGAGLVHFSSDYVFNGNKGSLYSESDEPDPVNIYGTSKLMGEQAVIESTTTYLIIRTSWLYGHRGSNFPTKIIAAADRTSTLRVVNDQLGSPSWSRWLADQVVEILTKLGGGPRVSFADSLRDNGGLYHIVSEGAVSRYDFAKAILEYHPERKRYLTHTVRPISTSDYPSAANRPANSALSSKLAQERFGLERSPWRIQLRNCLDSQNSGGEITSADTEGDW